MNVLTSANRFLSVFGIASFLLLSSLGIYHFGMSASMSDHQMSDCPFTPGVSLCTMSSMEMIDVSQNMFSSISQQKGFLFFLLLLVFFALYSFTIAHFARPFMPPRLSLLHIPLSKRARIPLYNYLREAFSDGILNPKPF